MVTLQPARCIRIGDLQDILRHVFVKSKRPSYVKYEERPVAVLFVHLTGALAHPLNIHRQAGMSEPIVFAEALPIETVLQNITKNIEVDPDDLPEISRESLDMVDKNDVRHIFGYTLFIESQTQSPTIEFTENTRTDERTIEDRQSDTESIEERVERLFSRFERPHRETEYFLVAVDCEMVRTRRGFSLGRVTLIDHRGNLLYDRYVKPKEEVTDYLSRWSGLSVDVLEDGICHEQAQREVLEIIGTNTYILGHGLEHDLSALGIYSENLIDTSYLFQSVDGYKIRLSMLSKKFLNESIQQEAHSSYEDAMCCLRLLRAKIGMMKRLVNDTTEDLDLAGIKRTIVLESMKEFDRGVPGIFVCKANKEDLSSSTFRAVCEDKKTLVVIAYEHDSKKYIVLQTRK